MKGNKFNRDHLSLIIELLLASCIFVAAWDVFSEVKESGWSKDVMKQIVMGSVLVVIAVLNVLRIFLERPPFEKLLKDNSHILNIHPNRKVVLAGHRISLYQIMKDLNSLQGDKDALNHLRNLYPTVDEGLLDQVVVFCEQNSRKLRPYFKQQQEYEVKMTRKIENRRAGFTLEELRRRRDEGLSSGQGAF